jgi:hypothetical protein
MSIGDFELGGKLIGPVWGRCCTGTTVKGKAIKTKVLSLFVLKSTQLEACAALFYANTVFCSIGKSIQSNSKTIAKICHHHLIVEKQTDFAPECAHNKREEY